MIKSFIKNTILQILHLIRWCLTKLRNYFLFIKQNIMPLKLKKTPNAFSISCYYIFQEDELRRCYETFKKHFYTSIFLNNIEMQEFAIKRSLKNIEREESDFREYFFLEFGVGKGTSCNRLSKFLNGNKFYGFDSFIGLREDWVGHVHHPEGSLSKRNILPKVKSNVVLVKGWIQDTLPNFLGEKKPKIKFVHVDCDTYETTKFILKNIKPYLSKGTIILFDEFYNFSGWSVGEYKALIETFEEKEYKYLAFSHNKGNVAIELT